MEMDRSNSTHLSREMASLKAEAEEQTLTGKTLRRVHGAYAQRQASELAGGLPDFLLNN